MARKRVAILISGRGSNMTALIEAAKDPAYPAEIVLVFTNRPGVEGIKRAEAAGISTSIMSDANRSREDFERVIDDALEAYRVDIVCLAGYMRLLTPGFVGRWQNRMLNIHPALLPAFKGLDTHARALAAGVKIHGATVHFVVPEMDSGPIVVQGAVPVLDNDNVETLAARVLAIEHRIYPLALRLLAEDRVRVVDGRCIIDGARNPPGSFIVPEI